MLLTGTIMLTIGVVDKHFITCLGIEFHLKDTFAISKLHHAPTLTDLLKQQSISNPHIIILGFSTETLATCVKVIREGLELYPNANLIVYAESQDINSISIFFSFGIKGYVMKNADPSDLENCIIENIKGRFYLGAMIRESFFDQLLKKTEAIPAGKKNKQLMLTDKEHAIAGFLCQGFSTSQIAKELTLHPSTVSTFKSKILKKMNVTNTFELIKVYPPDSAYISRLANYHH